MQSNFPDITIYDKSLVSYQGTSYLIGKHNQNGQKYLGVMGNTTDFSGVENENGALLCPLTSENAATIRARLPVCDR